MSRLMPTRPQMCVCAILTCTGFANSAIASDVTYRLTHTLIGGQSELFALSARGAGDVDNDGHGDLIVRGLTERYGRARVFSGTSGAELFPVDDLQGHAWLGIPIGGVGDLNSDGFDDIIVGDYIGGEFAAGVARVLSGADASELFLLEGPAGVEGFGAAVSAAGDLNGDRVQDIIVGSVGLGGQGAAVVYSGSDGLSLYTFMKEDEFGSIGLGTAVSHAGDVNADGVDDVIVAAHLDGPTYLNPGFPPFIPPFKVRHPNGSALVYSGADGSLLHRLLAQDNVPDPSSIDGFGYSVAGAGDVNNDGFDDLIVGTMSIEADFLGLGGFARVFSGVDGSVLYTFLHDDDVFDFWVSVDGLGDINGDGFDDVVVGSMQLDLPHSFVRIYSGADGSQLFLKEYLVNANRLTVSNAGDVNADGLADLIVGVAFSAFGTGFADVFESDIEICFADLTNNGSVDVSDLLLVINAWGPCVGCTEDLTRDGQVNVADLLQLIDSWGACP